MLSCSLRPVGGSLMVAIPKALLSALDLKANSVLDVAIIDNALVMRPRKQLKYSLAELCAEMDADPTIPFRDEEWENMAPVGQEVL